MIAVIDYGAGNIQSVVKALKFIGCDCIVTNKKEELLKADGAIMPGVGSFGDSMDSMIKTGAKDAVLEFIERERNKARQIDIKHYKDWRQVIKEIVECEMIISSSLHGLILSDAYHIPNVWIKFSDETFDGSFKYLDYFASVKRPIDGPLVIRSRLDLSDLLQYKDSYSPITFDAQKLLSVCPFIDKNKILP